MSNESMHPQQSTNNEAATSGVENAFSYLRSLPRNIDRPALESYRRNRESAVIDHEVAETFTDSFRGVATPFFIPLSWTLTKSALVNLLGITDFEGLPDVNGVRFYAGINDDNQLTLIAVSTMAGTDCNDDLTIDDNYPYYDFADPCPRNCSGSGNLRVSSGLPTPLKVAVVS